MSSSNFRREGSQDSVICLSDDDEDECIKIHYQESLEFFEIPIDNDGRISFEDVTLIDPNIVALIIQKERYKKLIKPKNGYWKEPKEQWDNFKVYAALKKQSEVKSKSHSPNENTNPNLLNATLNRSIKIESETPAILTEVPQNNVKSDHSRATDAPFNNINIEAKTLATLSPLQRNCQKLQNPSTTSSTPKNSANESSAQALTPAPINKFSSDSDESTSDGDESASDGDESASDGDEYGNCIKPVEEPTIDQILSAYKVSSMDELKYVLCRGGDVHEYDNTSSILISRFKRTLVAYPNNEFVRIFDWAKTSNILMKSLDSTVKEYCKLCKAALTLEHLISKFHAKKFHEKYNADPPEIAKLLEPEIYKQFIDPTVLASMNIPGFKKMKESPEFSIQDSSHKAELVKLKYILIRRILQANLRLNNKNTFSVAKLLFLQKIRNTCHLSKYFTIVEYDCEICQRFPKSFHDFMQHILSTLHLKKCLNQEELNGISNAMSYMEQTSDGFRFLPLPIDNRKRHQITVNVQESNKRSKKMQLYYFGSV